MTIRKSSYVKQASPILWAQVFKTVTIDTSYAKLPANLLINKGMFCSFQEDGAGDKYLKLYKSGKVYAAVSADTTINMHKNHNFGVGDSIWDASNEVTITDIDTDTYAAYDIITVDANVTLAENEIIYNIYDPTFASQGEPVHVIAEDVVFESGDTVSVSVAMIAGLDVYKLPNYWNGIANPFRNLLSQLVVVPVAAGINPAGVPSKVFRALLTQTGTADPTAEILENSLGEVPTLARGGAGSYTLTLVAALLESSKIFVRFSPRNGVALATNDFVLFDYVVTSTTVLTLGTYDVDLSDAFAATDALMAKAELEILIYD